MDWTTRFLRDLVAVDSVNPSLVPGAAGEGAIADLIARELRGIGLGVELQEVRPGRPNVIGVLEGRAPGRSVMFCGHIDTEGKLYQISENAAPFVRGREELDRAVRADAANA